MLQNEKATYENALIYYDETLQIKKELTEARYLRRYNMLHLTDIQCILFCLIECCII